MKSVLSKLSAEKDSDEVTIDTNHLRTIYEDYVNSSVWYSDQPAAIVDVVQFPIFWKRWWLYPFNEISRAVDRLTHYPSSSVFLFVLFTVSMWALVGFVSCFAFFFNLFLSFLYLFPFLTFLLPGSAVNWGTDGYIEDWDLNYGDLTSSKWDIDNCEFFIRSCALAYENPQSTMFGRVSKKWNIIETRTAARESAECHIWNWTKDKQGFVLLVFKGTSPFNWNEWLTDATAVPVGADNIVNDPDHIASVHQGFYEALFAPESRHWIHIIHQLNSACKDFHGDIKNIHVWVTGHSLGAATATLATCRLLLNPGDITDHRAKLRGSYTFGTPRVGNYAFVQIVTEAMKARENFNMHRVINANDIITMIPFQDPARTYVHFGDAHYLSFLGNIDSREDKKIETWNDFLRFRGLNLLFTVVEQVKILATFPLQIWSMDSYYNAMARLCIPFIMFDHFPSQYIEHLNLHKGK